MEAGGLGDGTGGEEEAEGEEEGGSSDKNHFGVEISGSDKTEERSYKRNNS